MTREGRWSKNFVIIIILIFLVYVTHIMAVVTFPFYISALNGQEWLAGLLQALFSVMSFGFRPVSGWLLDNGMRKKGLLIGVVGIILLPGGYMIVSSLALVAVMRVLHGALHSLASTTATTIGVDNIPWGRMSDGMGIVAMSTAVATCLAPAVSMYLRGRFGFRSVFLVCFGLSILALLLTIPLKAPELKTEKKPFQGKNLIEGRALPATVVFLTFLIAFGGVQNFLAKYAATKEELPDSTIFFALMALSFLITRVVLQKRNKAMKLSFFVYTGNASMLSALLLLAFVPGTVAFLAAGLLTGYGLGGIQPALQTAAVQASPLSRRGVANSTFLCGYDAGMGLGAFIAGALISAVGYELMFALIAIANVASAVFYAVSEKVVFHHKKEGAMR